ncbi:MAG: O-antigen ligase family protein [Chloroflexota bacterium]
MKITKVNELRTQVSDLVLGTTLIIEGIILLSLTLALWYDNTIRPQWFWLFWLAIPVFTVRWRITGRLWTHTRLHDVLILFVLLTAFNYAQAPLQKESYLAATARPLAGMWLFIYYIELTRITNSLRLVTILTVGLSAVLAFFALTSSQWVDGKLSYLSSLVVYLPQVDYRAVAEQFDGSVCSPIVDWVHTSNCFNPSFIIQRGFFSFNVNEIAGALTWLTPTMASIALIPSKATEDDVPYAWYGIRLIAILCFVVMVITMIFGQSRFALLGLFTSLGMLLALSPIKRFWRVAGAVMLGILIIIQVTLTFNLFPVEASTQAESSVEVGLSERDERSVSTRLQIWNRGVEMMTDQPLTGVGMYMFRTAVANEPYIIPYFQEQNNPPPHAHNEWIHISAEMGILGLLIFVGAQIIVLNMLWVGWRSEDMLIRQVALASFCGLLAHAIYGLGDTIALWDRFQFVLWCLLGLVGAQYSLAKTRQDVFLAPFNFEDTDS